MTRFLPVKMLHPPVGESSLCSYGIIAEEYDGSKWIQVAVVPDVSCDEAFVLALSNKCTQGQLSPIHLLDVVLDSIP